MECFRKCERLSKGQGIGARARWHRTEALAACAANHPLDDEQTHYTALCQAPAR